MQRSRPKHLKRAGAIAPGILSLVGLFTENLLPLADTRAFEWEALSFST
jgi:hypothetical protein